MRIVGLALLTATLLHISTASADTATIQVDLRDTPRGMFHSDMRFPAKPGPMTFVYPRWIPGDHLPAGPIENVAGLVFRTNGQRLAWKRDPINADAFHITVPDDADHVDVHFDFLAVAPLVTGINQASKATTDDLAILRWHVATLYPEDATAATYEITPSVMIPAGWKYRTALTPTTTGPGTITFAQTDLRRLIDSPLVTGSHQQTYRLTPKATSIPHSITITADDPADLVMTPAQQQHLSATIDQALAMFGPPPFPHYDFLLTISGKLRSSVSIGGQEHMESSDNLGAPGVLRDPAGRASLGETLAHEYAHSWNGKYRRPIGEVTKNYQQANDNSLLWVYEGLTTYLGKVLAVRSGAWSEQDYRDDLAGMVAGMMAHEGREWRPLIDTAVGLQALMRSRFASWGNWRRVIDYYEEGSLLWMDVDVEIRRLTNGKRSLDDFSRIFFAKGPNDSQDKAYNLSEVVADLNKVAPTDWNAFFSARLDTVNSQMPLELLKRAGWSLNWRPRPSPFLSGEESDGSVNSIYSIGTSVTANGEIVDVRIHSPADKAGLAPGMKILTIAGQQYSSDHLRAAIAAGGSIVISYTNGGTAHNTTIQYAGGEKYPVLQRADGPDLITAIVRPLPVVASR